MNNFNFSDIIYLDPNSIQVSRSTRQRKEIDISDILESIRENGIINPIIIKNPTDSQADDNPILVAGERRLEACKRLNIQAPCRLLNSLSPLEAQIIEFEENHKRKNLSWREEVSAIGTICDLSRAQNPPLTNPQIAKSLSLDEQKLSQILHVYKFKDEKILIYAENLSQAINLLHKFKSQKSEELKSNLKQILDKKPIPDYLKPKPKELIIDPEIEEKAPTPPVGGHQNESPPILNLNFLDWIKNYEGPPFNFIHCDFPNNEEEFWPIFDSFTWNINSLLDNPCHIMFWLKMEYYEKVIEWFKNDGEFEVNLEPLIWYKSDTKQNQIYGDPPKSTYETALIINHNSRPFKKQIQNAYHTPRASQPICPNQKNISMLKYFLSTFIDSETTVLDPTCGSGSALIAAEELRAKSILGLEINQERSQKANEKILRAREVRKLLEK